MQIIISGVPCSGKTTFGDWLQQHRQFEHHGLESERNRFRQRVNRLLGDDPLHPRPSGNVVVTWGYPPQPEAFALIAKFESRGYEPWWFDTDIARARIRYISRSGLDAAQKYFDVQVSKIVACQGTINVLYGSRKIRTFDVETAPDWDAISRRMADFAR